MNHFTLIFISLLFTYGLCLCDQNFSENQLNLIVKENSTIFKYKQSGSINQQIPTPATNQNDNHNLTTLSTNLTQITATTARNSLSFNQTNLDLKPISLNNLLDRMYRKNDMHLNSTQFKEMNIIDKEKDMQTAAGHKHHKVVEHHHHHHHGIAKN